jgi:hypothetical protein
MSKKYIITTGDISDFDGFLAFPLYKQKAYDIGADVVFIMNYPAYMTDNKGINKSGGFSKSVKHKKKGGEGVNQQQKFDEIAKKIAERQMLTADEYLFLDLYERSEEGKGYTYNSKDLFKIQPLNEDALNYFKSLPKDYSLDTYKDKMHLLAMHMCNLVWNSCDVIRSPDKRYPKFIFVDGGVNEINPFSIRTIKNEFNVYCPALKSLESGEFNYVMNQNYPFSKSVVNEATGMFTSTTFAEFLKKLNQLNDDKIYMDMNGSMAFYDFLDESLKGLFLSRLKKVFIMGGVLDNPEVSTLSTNIFLNRFASATMNQLYAKKKTGQFFTDIYQYNIKNTNNKIKVYTVSNNEINKNFKYDKIDKITNDIKTTIMSAKTNYKNTMQELSLIPNILALPTDHDDTITKRGRYVIKLFDAFYDAQKPADLNLHQFIYNPIFSRENALLSLNNNTPEDFYKSFFDFKGKKTVLFQDNLIDALVIPQGSLVPTPYKPFDALSALALVLNIDNTDNKSIDKVVTYSDNILAYIPEYGSTIISKKKETSSIVSIKKETSSIVPEYLNKGLSEKIMNGLSGQIKEGKITKEEAIGLYESTDEFIALSRDDLVVTDIDVTDITFEHKGVIEDQIKKFLNPKSQSGGYKYRSRSVKKTNKKPKKKPTPVKTPGKYTSKDGVSRQLYVMGEQLYVKMKDSKEGIFVYKKIKGAK